MVRGIYYVEIPYSDFSKLKGRPVLVFHQLQNDFLFLPLTSNLTRDGVRLNNSDLESGFLKKESVVVVPKISAIDCKIIKTAKLLATIDTIKFKEILSYACNSLQCYKI
ncbi:MAG: growth inhibitor PemK [Gammaproteobacteria bacterium]|nr:MAG: growth inhibitor PemK [Gammaproteobacteria bacterium]